MRTLAARSLALVTFLVLSTPVFGQSVTDPTAAEFSPSPDHSQSSSDGTPLVSGYDLEFYLLGAAAPFQTQGLNKPAPGGDGLIRVPLASVSAMPTGMVFESRVRAVGPGGSTISQPSNSFMFSVACTYAAAPASHSFGAGGGTGSLTMTTGAGCSWQASTNVSWIVLASNAGGSGTGSLDFSVTANSTSSTRSGAITVGAQTVTVTQTGTTPCGYTVDTTPTSFQAAGGTGTSSVSAPSGCGWTARSDTSWITMPQGASGSGNGSVTFSATANTSTTARQGTITVAGRTVQIAQSGATSCAYSVSPITQPFGASGGAGATAVTTTSGCTWTATTSASWITVTGGGSGTGSGRIDYQVVAYTGSSSRTGTISVGGATLTITQAPPSSCSVTVTPVAISVGAASSQASLAVATSANCPWAAVSQASWVTVASGASGTGGGVVALRIARNTGSTQRTGTVTVAGQTITVTQSERSGGSGPSKPKNFRVTSRR